MTPLRLILILLLAASLGASILIVRRFAGDAPDAARRETDSYPDPDPDPRRADSGPDPEEPPLAFASNRDCQPCHREIFDEWMEDEHARAWFNAPLLPKDPTRTECNNCHAPSPILEVGLDALPRIRADRFEEGVGCLECHRAGDRVEGPLRAGEAPCRPAANPVFHESAICKPCHAPHGSYGEWRASEFAAKGIPCQGCHMPIVDAPVVTDGEPVRRRSHRMRSQRDPEFLGRAVAADARLLPSGELLVEITNAGAGHNVPGEISNRELFLRATILDAKGEIVREHRESFAPVPRAQRATEPSTQLRPGQTAAFRYDAGGGADRVRVSLRYKLLRFIPDERAIVIWEKELDL
ncbi:MAG: hypothetical protein JXP34_14320 [Planctomycetes bacterium]|nr:hypothetical protein [Planctomycetota bacterium]